MKKKRTGIAYTPYEFRRLNQCTECGYATNILYGERCNDCVCANRNQCKMCECVLWKGERTMYTYDIFDSYRENGVEFKVSKKMIREFIYKKLPYREQITNDLCAGCVDWKKRIKNICFKCKKRFNNTEQNYKLNGNFCQICIYGEETGND